jgi:hypothetical protein
MERHDRHFFPADAQADGLHYVYICLICDGFSHFGTTD